MHWIALRWLSEGDEASASAIPAQALGWWALQYTPRVTWLDEALLLEVAGCERLWGGRLALMRQLSLSNPATTRIQQAHGGTSLIALARLRLYAQGRKPPADIPVALPLHTLSAAREHLDLLARMGCRTWGDVAALPRGGLARRFGAGLREALDIAWGLAPERHTWLTLPDVFDHKLELPALAESAPELMWSANRLLAALQVWLRARQRGVLALELQWTLDLKRFNGVDLPPHQAITVRTAQATQDMAHLRRLMSERLALTQLAAPASWLRLRSLETAPCAGASTSFLPEDNRKGDKLHELIERLSARLGREQVLVPVMRADHRPERMQTWQPALHQRKPAAGRKATSPPADTDRPPPGRSERGRAPFDILPHWLLRKPLPLELRDGHPWYQGRLRRLLGPQRLASGWWGDARQEGGHPALRDYYIAESPQAGLLWIYRERAASPFAEAAPRWFLQGIYG